MQGVLKEPNILAEAGQGLLGAGMSYLKGDMSGVISAGSQLLKKLTTGRAAKETARRTKTSPADVIQFSGCKDNQTSADAVEQVSSFSFFFSFSLVRNWLVRDKRPVRWVGLLGRCWSENLSRVIMSCLLISGSYWPGSISRNQSLVQVILLIRICCLLFKFSMDRILLWSIVLCRKYVCRSLIDDRIYFGKFVR